MLSFFIDLKVTFKQTLTQCGARKPHFKNKGKATCLYVFRRIKMELSLTSFSILFLLAVTIDWCGGEWLGRFFLYKKKRRRELFKTPLKSTRNHLWNVDSFSLLTLRGNNKKSSPRTNKMSLQLQFFFIYGLQ